MSFSHFDQLFEDISIQLNIPYEDLQQALTRVFSRLSLDNVTPSLIKEEDIELTQLLEEETHNLKLPINSTLSCYFYLKSVTDDPISYNKIIDIINEKYNSKFITPCIIDSIVKENNILPK
jgi:hypothetical protein